MSRVHVRPTARTRQRRRRRRTITLAVYVVIVFALAWYLESQGTTTIIFVRHADIDRPQVQNEDVPLNATGLARAELLADFLESIDVVAGVNAIYVSPFTQTHQTAAPIAKRLGLDYEVADPYNVVSFMKTVLFEHKREIILVVTHSDIIAPLVEELHGSKNIAEIAPDDYDDIFIVTIPWWGKVKTLQFPYGGGL